MGERVHHSVFGDGELLREDEDSGTVVVKFDQFGERRLKAELLTRADE